MTVVASVQAQTSSPRLNVAMVGDWKPAVTLGVFWTKTLTPPPTLPAAMVESHWSLRALLSAGVTFAAPRSYAIDMTGFGYFGALRDAEIGPINRIGPVVVGSVNPNAAGVAANRHQLAVAAVAPDRGVDRPGTGRDPPLGEGGQRDPVAVSLLAQPPGNRHEARREHELRGRRALDLGAAPELAAAVRAELLAFSACMRSQGVEGFPDPAADFDGVKPPRAMRRALRRLLELLVLAELLRRTRTQRRSRAAGTPPSTVPVAGRRTRLRPSSSPDAPAHRFGELHPPLVARQREGSRGLYRELQEATDDGRPGHR